MLEGEAGNTERISDRLPSSVPLGTEKYWQSFFGNLKEQDCFTFFVEICQYRRWLVGLLAYWLIGVEAYWWNRKKNSLDGLFF